VKMQFGCIEERGPLAESVGLPNSVAEKAMNKESQEFTGRLRTASGWKGADEVVHRGGKKILLN